MKKLLLALVGTMASFVATAASATTMHYTGTATGFSADLMLTLSDTLDVDYPTGYAILAASGTIDGVAIDGVVPPSGSYENNGTVQYDNVAFTDGTGPYFDYNGWLFSTGGGTEYFNFYSVAETPVSSDPDYVYNYPDNSFGNPGLVLDHESLTNAPEPLTLSLMGAGLAGIGAMRRKQRLAA